VYLRLFWPDENITTVCGGIGITLALKAKPTVFRVGPVFFADERPIKMSACIELQKVVCRTYLHHPSALRIKNPGREFQTNLFR
jgi:hypothetical protein